MRYPRPDESQTLSRQRRRKNLMDRVCKTCGLEKPEVSLTAKKRRLLCFSCEYKSSNKKKAKARNKIWRDNQPGSFDLPGRYGITQDDYLYMLEKQGGVCAICGKKNKATSRRKRLHVDHDHKIGGAGIRGLLCNLCNAWLGRIEDNIEAVLRAFAYLRRMQCPYMSTFVHLVEKSLIESNLSKSLIGSGITISAPAEKELN